MKLECPRSGIEYTTSIGWGRAIAPHPIFHLTAKELVETQLNPYTLGELSSDETHLFGCALLNTLPIIWRTTIPKNSTLHIWKNNLEILAAISLRHSQDVSNIPGFVIDSTTRNLITLPLYLNSIDKALMEPIDPDKLYDTSNYDIKIEAETTILRLLRTSLSSAEKNNKLPRLMANWAADVGKFPTSSFTLLSGETTTLRDYWKDVIYKLFNFNHASDILSQDITRIDIIELIEHCEANIPFGTLHSLALFKRLRNSKNIIEEFKPSSITSNTAIELLKTDSGPAPEIVEVSGPKIADFPTLSQYISAKKRYLANVGEE